MKNKTLMLMTVGFLSGCNAPNSPINETGSSFKSAQAVAQSTAIYNRFAYVTQAASDRIIQYGIDSQTYQLVELSSVSVQTGANACALVIHPNGKWLYTTNCKNQRVSQYTIDSVTGALSPMPIAQFSVSVTDTTIVTKDIGFDTVTGAMYVSAYKKTNLGSYADGLFKVTVNAQTGQAGSDGYVQQNSNGFNLVGIYLAARPNIKMTNIVTATTQSASIDNVNYLITTNYPNIDQYENGVRSSYTIFMSEPLMIVIK